MLRRALGDGFPEDVGRHIALLTLARTAANGCFRFAPPFLATMASGLGVSLDTIGIAVAVSELSGLMSPITGSVAERFHRRTAMATGLASVAVAAIIAASAPNVVVLALALVLLNQSKVLFDLGLGAWVSDRVPYERRGRVIGLTETSWAGGLLLGVSTMGLVTAATNWRVGYAVGAVAVVIMASLVRARIEDDPEGHQHARRTRERVRLPRIVFIVAAGTLCLMAASQMLFVTFGSWLRDEFRFSDSGVAALSFGLGFGEVLSALASSRLADRWRKERAGAVGAAVMVPAALLLAVNSESMLIGIPLLILAIAAFEFAVVSIIPLGTMVVPGAPALGMSVMLACGTLGRALASIPATRLYVDSGITWPAVLCAALCFGTIASMWRVDRWHHRTVAD
ncbi:MAG: MFS transporter [Ilumatobacteraceae bacterium]